MRIKDWERFQHYKSGPHAEKPPEWIKLYPRLLNDLEWHKLSGDDAKALMCLWMLASENSGNLPCIEKIAFRLRLSEKQVKSVLSRLHHWIDEPSRDALEPVYTASSLEEEREEEEKKKHTSPNGAAGVSGSDVRKAFENYNTAAEQLDLPKAEKLTPERDRKLRARLKEHGISGWNQALQALCEQPFCLGQGGRGWKANLDFLLQPESFNKVLERAYAGVENGGL